MDPNLPAHAPNQETTGINPPAAPTPPSSTGTPLPKKFSKKLLIIIGGAVLLLILMSISLILMTPKKKPVPIPTPTPTIRPTKTPTPTPTKVAEQIPVMQYLPGKQYYNDTVYIITKDNPHRVITVSATRADQGSNYLQATNATYFDGSSWSTDSLTTVTDSSAVSSNTMIRNWSSNINAASKDTSDISLSFSINGVPMLLSKQTIQDEINLLSLPEYTKFASQGTGDIHIGNTTHPAMYVYTRAYSVNAANLAFLSNPSDLSTEWMAMWDEQGKFYLADTLYKKNAKTGYQNYKVGIVQDAKGNIIKTSKITYGPTVTDQGRFILNLDANYFDVVYLTSYNYAKQGDSYTATIGPADGNVKVGNTNPLSYYVLGIYQTNIPQ